MLDGMSDSIQGSRIENLHSREVDRQSPTGLIFRIMVSVNRVRLRILRSEVWSLICYYNSVISICVVQLGIEASACACEIRLHLRMGRGMENSACHVYLFILDGK